MAGVRSWTAFRKTSARDCGGTMKQGRYRGAGVSIEGRCTSEVELELSPEEVN